MLNHIVVMGRLAKDPELRHTQAGTAVASFTVACNRDIKDKNTGERATDWIDVVAWGSTAEFVSKYFAKGQLAVVDGRLQLRDWVAKDGTKRRSAEVVANNIYFGDSKRDNDNGNNTYGGGYSTGGGYNNNRAPAENNYAPAAPAYDAPSGDDRFADVSDEDEDALPF